MDSRNKLSMCRLCLCENECFINIFEVNDWQGYVAAEVIYDLLQFQVSETDIYPQVVCSKCLLKLTDFKLFKECCQHSKVMYDNVFVASESLEEHKPKMDIGYGGSGLEFCEQDPLREETSDPIIKQEELDISGDESEGTNTKVSFGPMLLKHKMRSFNRDSDTQDVGGYRSDSELCEQDPLGEASSHPIVKPEELDIDSSVDGYDEPFEGTNTQASFEAISLKDEMLSFHRNCQTKCVIGLIHPKYLKSLEQTAPYCTSLAAFDADSCTRTISTNDESIFVESKSTSISVEVEALSSGTMEGSAKALIPPGERIHMATLYEHDVYIGKERGRDEEDAAGEGEGERQTCSENCVIEERKRFECYHCGIVMNTKGGLIRHMVLHGFDEYYECEVCGKGFESNSAHIKHMRSHTGYKACKCSECSKSFSENGNLIKHMRTHTSSKPYKCVECSNSFRESGTLKRHMRIHTGSKPYKCSECSKCFTQKSTLDSHMRTHTGSKPYKCSECSKYFTKKSNLNSHMRTHTGSKPYKCSECSKSFSENGNLIKHIRSHTGYKAYKCSECSKSFSENGNLIKHMRTHTGSKPYKCVECSNSFRESGTLKRHMRIHTGSKPYKCSECSKCFTQKSTLDSHMRTHTGSKPYKCSECSKYFTKKSNLNSHMRTHTGSKPYKCSECSKCFIENVDLIKHMRTHTGSKPYKCVECSKCFRENGDLTKHMRTHTAYKPYQCVE